VKPSPYKKPFLTVDQQLDLLESRGVEMKRNPNVVILGEDIGKFGGVFRPTARPVAGGSTGSAATRTSPRCAGSTISRSW
jgi:hypothetical protein